MRPQVGFATIVTIPIVLIVLFAFASHKVKEYTSKTTTPTQVATSVDAGQGE